MKNLIYIILLAGITLVSCDDIITEKPIDFLVPGSFPANEQDALAATTAAYTRLHNSIISFYYGFTPSDIAFQGQHNMRPISWFLDLNDNNGDATALWQSNYQGIALANTVIEYVPNVPMNDQNLKERLIAEAKFLRAFYYFELVRVYGEVPILTEVISNTDELIGITRNSVEEVYALIEQDLIEALSILPSEYDAEEKGRATKWSATALLAKVHLTQGEWLEANTRAEEVIASGMFGLVADYNSLWSQNAEYVLMPDKNGVLVNENVFDIQFEQDERNDYKQSWVGSRDTEIVGATNAVGGGWENMLPTTTYLNMFEDGDLRKEISYITELDGNVLESPRTPGAGPITGKYLNIDGDAPKTNNGSQNTYVIRYSDVLLMRAEAENELNGPTNAYPFINLVRERAGLSPLFGLDQTSFRLALRKERATELGFEGHRKYDLLRWGVFVETVRSASDPHLAVPASNIQNHHILLPVPAREREISEGSLSQNPGY
ncbi:RagB/SusD family nutrient uptake outer membrane protein [Arenibacter sp. 6A1]|uniref:RagB/SusD family nutrient uptake outer membrane protein n=1 Tax=Arenibacter sp. 6A1 TaxID=2720391 RepID=UPI001444FE73|nr:RagB/SusD family nutrient uptake outer membrane protein [Arenibacter sp. 6A1]NKI28400.1 RagB/SusD family nutrient uptake outer membrane protein [Arenibacter sp. 6A1]